MAFAVWVILQSYCLKTWLRKVRLFSSQGVSFLPLPLLTLFMAQECRLKLFLSSEIFHVLLANELQSIIALMGQTSEDAGCI